MTIESEDRETQKGKVLVNDTYLYRLITKEAPFGTKCLLINRSAGVACVGVLNHTNTFFTHYAPIPTFED